MTSSLASNVNDRDVRSILKYSLHGPNIPVCIAFLYTSLERPTVHQICKLFGTTDYLIGNVTSKGIWSIFM